MENHPRHRQYTGQARRSRRAFRPVLIGGGLFASLLLLALVWQFSRPPVVVEAAKRLPVPPPPVAAAPVAAQPAEPVLVPAAEPSAAPAAPAPAGIPAAAKAPAEGSSKAAAAAPVPVKAQAPVKVPAKAPAKSPNKVQVKSSASVQAVAKRPGCWLQVGVFRNSANAQRLRASLAQTGWPATLELAEIDGQPAQRLRLGPYADRSAAEAAQYRLGRLMHLDTFIVDTP